MVVLSRYRLICEGEKWERLITRSWLTIDCFNTFFSQKLRDFLRDDAAREDCLEKETFHIASGYLRLGHGGFGKRA